ncbi:MAG TPA: efflux RND transporter periplasmic adaptor subunit [Gemmatimonadales bacterium]|nr:efflux RND transporter periplasmic adaptor subunit [Gemmatimonadales bacterium]
MRRVLAILALGAIVPTACRRESESQPAAGMTPEQHAQMGGTITRGDSGGTAAREPVMLTPAQATALGVTYVTVERGPLFRVVRTVGQVVPAESKLADITPKIDGFIERMFVDATGMAVRRGQPLLTLYSPMLVTAQQELLTARQLAVTIDSSQAEAWRNARDLVAAARRRLAYWDISTAQIARLEQTGEVTKTLTLTAPFDGVVLEKMVVAGQGVMAGMRLYRLADLSTVWVEGEVFEQDLAAVKVGASARVEVAAYPGRPFVGRVSFVYPVVDEQSRTARVRIALPNPDRALRPGMYATLYFDTRLGVDLLSLPSDAIVMTGARDLVFVSRSDGMLEARQVTLGARAGERVQVLQGVKAGERVLASANFLVDAESRLGTGKGMPGMPGMQQ